MTTLYLVRHGETEENVAQILQGHLPGHLSVRGKEQAIALRCRLVAECLHFDAMVASDLQRTADTAKILNEALHLPLTTTPLLRERDWGSLTGVPIAQAKRNAFPCDIESVADMHQRAKRFLIYIMEHFPEQRVLAVGHGLFNRCILATLAGVSIGMVPRMENAEIRCVQVTPTKGLLPNDFEDVATAN